MSDEYPASPAQPTDSLTSGEIADIKFWHTKNRAGNCHMERFPWPCDALRAALEVERSRAELADADARIATLVSEAAILEHDNADLIQQRQAAEARAEREHALFVQADDDLSDMTAKFEAQASQVARQAEQLAATRATFFRVDGERRTCRACGMVSGWPDPQDWETEHTNDCWAEAAIAAEHPAAPRVVDGGEGSCRF